jgi:hypothetical protein
MELEKTHEKKSREDITGECDVSLLFSMVKRQRNSK